MLSRTRIVDAFNKMAVLLELSGANSFKISAYTKAARILADESIDLDERVAKGTLVEIEGIGKGIAEKVAEFAESGRITELAELETRFPPGLIKMTAIPGFGAKKIRTVYDELGVETIEQLAAACQDGRIAALKGFGEKTAQKILVGIEVVKSHSGRFHLHVAHRAAEMLLNVLLDHPAVIRAQIAGSLRRSRETVKDLDFVVATEKPDEVMEAFTTHAVVDRVTGKGSTKASVVLDSGLGADLRCVAPDQFSYALAHFTGSMQHNVRLRQRANDRGMKLNEYGLFPDGSDEPLAAATEEDIYRHLDLQQFIPPELREDMGEVEAAHNGAIPKLIESADIRGLLHMHTTYSDGRAELEDYCRWAREHHIAWMGITDHSKTAAYAGGLTVEKLRVQWAEINRLNKEWKAEGIQLLKGIESDILTDGSLDYDDEILEKFDFIVASVHNQFQLDEDAQTKRLIAAVENPFTTILGHMTGRLLLRRDGYSLRQKEVIEAAARAGTAIEVNCNPYRLDMDWRLVHFALDKGVRIAISPDAHDIAGLDDVRFGIGIGRKGWLTSGQCLNCLTTEEFLEFARSKRAS